MELIQDFFADFPDIQDKAINLVYDMCEDQDQKVNFKRQISLHISGIELRVDGHLRYE